MLSPLPLASQSSEPLFIRIHVTGLRPLGATPTRSSPSTFLRVTAVGKPRIPAFPQNPPLLGLRDTPASRGDSPIVEGSTNLINLYESRNSYEGHLRTGRTLNLVIGFSPFNSFSCINTSVHSYQRICANRFQIFIHVYNLGIFILYTKVRNIVSCINSSEAYAYLVLQ